MRLRFDAQGEAATFGRLASELADQPEVNGLMVLACDANGWTPEVLEPILRSMAKPVFGGVFPQIIHDRRNWSRGTLVIGLPCHPDVVCLNRMSDSRADYDSVLEPYADRWVENAPHHEDTLIVFVDGLSDRVAALMESLFYCFGLERNLIGGGAGSISFERKPCLITSGGLLTDAALVVRLPMRSGVGVAHGWHPISESLKVTEAHRNTIRSLEWRPAFEVYRELVEAHSGLKFANGNFLDIAKGYPLGINKLGGEVVVRDPLKQNDHRELVCIGEVPKGSFVRLLNGSPETLIAAAAHARDLAELSNPASEPDDSIALFMDCISRAMFLGDRIVDELEAAAGERPLCGALTLGEIANNGRDYLEYYNKTLVLGLLSEPS